MKTLFSQIWKKNLDFDVNVNTAPFNLTTTKFLNISYIRLIHMLHIVAPIIKTNVAAKMEIEKKYLDFIDHFSECNFLMLIPNSIGTKTINGIVISSKIALKKLFGIIFSYDIKIKHRKNIKQIQLKNGIIFFVFTLILYIIYT